MATGLGLLGITPDAFWRMTPRELAAAVTGRLAGAVRDLPMSGGDLAELMQRYPDR